MKSPKITTITTYSDVLYTFTLPVFIALTALGIASLASVSQAWFALYATTVMLTAVKWVGTKVWKAVKDTVAEMEPAPST